MIPAIPPSEILRQAELVVLDRYPYHLRQVLRWQHEPTPGLNTLGVEKRKNHYVLLYDPSYVAATALPRLVGVLLHEIHHIVLGHADTNRRRFADPEVYLAACELSANEYIIELLPGQPLRLSSFLKFNFPPGERTLRRYKRLLALKRAGLLKLEPPVACCRTPAIAKPSTGGASTTPQPTTGNGGESNSRILLPRPTEAAIMAAYSAVRAFALDDDAEPTRNWPSRRAPDLLGIVSGYRSSSDSAPVVAVLDTSESVAPAHIAAAVHALVRLALSTRVVIVESDYRVRKVYELRRAPTHVSGGGGTDFSPGLDVRLVRAQLRARVIVYFTDGVADVIPRNPGVPVTWALFGRDVPPAPWGRVVRVS